MCALPPRQPAGQRGRWRAALLGPQFTTRWQNIDVETLISTVEALMPLEEPGSLSRQVYVDILAYVLWANRLPAGARRLPTSPEDLEKIVVAFPP